MILSEDLESDSNKPLMSVYDATQYVTFPLPLARLLFSGKFKKASLLKTGESENYLFSQLTLPNYMVCFMGNIRSYVIKLPFMKCLL